MELRPITSLDAPAVAALHIEGIGTGFISSLGIDFVTALYEAIAKSKLNFVKQNFARGVLAGRYMDILRNKVICGKKQRAVG